MLDCHAMRTEREADQMQMSTNYVPPRLVFDSGFLLLTAQMATTAREVGTRTAVGGQRMGLKNEGDAAQGGCAPLANLVVWFNVQLNSRLHHSDAKSLHWCFHDAEL